MASLLKMLSLLILVYATTVLCLCTDDQLCVTEKRCNETDDSGAGILRPRILSRSCGTGLVCCDKEQLESYDREQKHIMSRTQQTSMIKTQTTTTTTAPLGLDFKDLDLNLDLDANEPDYRSCGTGRLCVPRHLCRTGTVNVDGRFIIKPRIFNETNAGCLRFESCCPEGDKLGESENQVRRDVMDFKYKGCGYSNPGGLYYDLEDYNENESLYAQFPWMVAILDMQANYICGGTLIHPQLVLTSAHNVANQSADALLVRAGEYDMSHRHEPLEFQTRRLRGLWRHEKFNKYNNFNDISLIVLERPFELAPHIQPLCLPPLESPKLQAELSTAQCYAIGWGQRNVSDHFMAQVLKRIELPFVDHASCQRLLRRTILGKRFKLDDSFMCAGGIDGRDTCQGDGGSPLFCSIAGQSNRFQLIGIVSWGVECAMKDFPAAYTNVPYLKTWIEEQTWKVASIDLSQFAP